MELYRALYFQLFAAAADAVEALEAQDTEKAREILIQAQQRAEEAVLASDEPV